MAKFSTCVVGGLISFAITSCSGATAQEDRYCEDGLGTTTCITTRADGRGNYQAVVDWSYDEPRDLGNGLLASSSQWGANVVCELSDGTVTYVRMNDEQGNRVKMDANLSEQVRLGLTDNALPRIISKMCS